MKLTVLLILISQLFVLRVFTQDNRKYWSDGKLTWDDFQEKMISIDHSDLKYFFGYDPEKKKSGDSLIVRAGAFCYMDKNSSWINTKYKNDSYLKYNQVIFDITELYRRKLQFELDRSKSYNKAQIRFRKIYEEMTGQIDEFRRESGDGLYEKVTDKWLAYIEDEIDNLAESPGISAFRKKNFGYGMHVGFGSGIFTGSLGSHFGPTFNFILGFDLAYKRSIFYLIGTLAGGKVKKDYLSENNWYAGQRVNVAIIDISYGYAVIDKPKITLSPFAGLGITELSGKNRDDEQNDLLNQDYNIIFGLNADYKFRKSVRLTPGMKESFEGSVRARLYITRANYSDDLKGFSVNLTIGVCGFGNMMKMKE